MDNNKHTKTEDIDRIMLSEVAKVRYWLTKAYNHCKAGEDSEAVQLIKNARDELTGYLNLRRY